jgi:ABC-type molybdate transport system permease subunit
MSASRAEFLKSFDTLPLELQERVIGLVQTLASTRGVAGSTLTVFAGSIPPPEIEQMSQAISTECERIDDGW